MTVHVITDETGDRPSVDAFSPEAAPTTVAGSDAPEIESESLPPITSMRRLDQGRESRAVETSSIRVEVPVSGIAPRAASGPVSMGMGEVQQRGRRVSRSGGRAGVPGHV